jgi:hypothetical protein
VAGAAAAPEKISAIVFSQFATSRKSNIFSQPSFFSNAFDGMVRGLFKRQITHPQRRDQACRL